MSSLSAKVVGRIEKDIRGRGGLEDVWELLDVDTKEEIIGTWMDIIDEELEKRGVVFNDRI